MTSPRENAAPQPFFRHLDRPTPGGDGQVTPYGVPGPAPGFGPRQPASSGPSAPAAPPSGLAQASSVLGVLSLLGAVFVITLPVGIVAAVLGAVEVRRARRAALRPARPAVLGVVTGLAAVAVAGGVLAYLLTRPGFGDYWRCLRAAGTTDQMRTCLSRFTRTAP